ncbi:hypothetical protein HMPREF2955_09915 [Prevotella sp. HMSC073D09]|nr:hypothetical protein HMPREF2955_09915 [Prevotella sp. HMSC073D09]
MAVSLNKNSFYCIHRPTPFSKTNLRENLDFLRQGERLVDKKGTHNVKFIIKTRQKKYVVNTHE